MEPINGWWQDYEFDFIDDMGYPAHAIVSGLSLTHAMQRFWEYGIGKPFTVSQPEFSKP